MAERVNGSALEGLLDMLTGRYAADPTGREHRDREPGGRRALRRRERDDLQMLGMTSLSMRSERIDRVLRERENRTTIRLRLAQRGGTLDRVVRRAAEYFAVSESSLRQGVRHRAASRARRLVAHFGGVHLGATDASIARATGVSSQAIWKAKRVGANVAAECGLSWKDFFEIGGAMGGSD